VRDAPVLAQRAATGTVETLVSAGLDGWDRWPSLDARSEEPPDPPATV